MLKSQVRFFEKLDVIRLSKKGVPKNAPLSLLGQIVQMEVSGQTQLA